MLRPRHEDGSALVLALVFLSLFGLATAALLGFAETSFRTTLATRSIAGVTYAVDGAVETAINNLRGNLLLGRDPSIPGVTACPTLTVPGTNGQDVQVQCAGEPGSGAYSGGTSALNRPPTALLTLGTAALDGVGVGDDAPLRVRGQVFSNTTVTVGAGTASALNVDGDVSAIGNCTGKITTTAPPLHCANTGGGANPANGADPGYAPAVSSAPPYQVAPACPAGWLVTLTPGTYDDADALTTLTSGCGGVGKVVWLQPGVYYFDFKTTNRIWTMGDEATQVVGGTPNGWVTTAGSRPPIPFPGGCKTERDPAPNAGVQLIFGADSRVSMEGSAVELCADPSATTQQIAIYGLKSGTATPVTTTLQATQATNVSSYTPSSGQNAFAIDVALTESAVLPSQPTPPSASLTLKSFATIPAGSTVTSAKLRVAHQESPTASIASMSAVVTPGTGAPVTYTPVTSATYRTDTFDLFASGIDTVAELTGITVAYSVTGKASLAGTTVLDGMVVDVTYVPPSFEAQSGCVVTAGGCPVVAVAKKSQLAVKGTVYVPRAALDIKIIGVGAEVLSRGAIARSVFLRFVPSVGYGGYGVALPDIAATGPADRVVRFTALVGGVPKLRATVRFNDLAGTLPGSAVVVQAWSMTR